MVSRDELLKLLHQKVKSKNLIKHMLATEACMRALADRMGEDKEKWGVAGLVHDIDYEETKDNFDQHGLVSARMLEEMGFPQDIIDAVKAHAGKKEPTTKMEWALYAVDPLTGLIVAAALMHPSKSLTGIDRDFVLRRFKEKRFAAGANRDQIRQCEKLGLTLEEFIDICVKAMQGIAKELGL